MPPPKKRSPIRDFSLATLQKKLRSAVVRGAAYERERLAYLQMECHNFFATATFETRPFSFDITNWLLICTNFIFEGAPPESEALISFLLQRVTALLERPRDLHLINVYLARNNLNIEQETSRMNKHWKDKAFGQFINHAFCDAPPRSVVDLLQQFECFIRKVIQGIPASQAKPNKRKPVGQRYLHRQKRLKSSPSVPTFAFTSPAVTSSFPFVSSSSSAVPISFPSATSMDLDNPGPLLVPDNEQPSYVHNSPFRCDVQCLPPSEDLDAADPPLIMHGAPPFCLRLDDTPPRSPLQSFQVNSTSSWPAFAAQILPYLDPYHTVKRPT